MKGRVVHLLALNPMGGIHHAGYPWVSADRLSTRGVCAGFYAGSMVCILSVLTAMLGVLAIGLMTLLLLLIGFAND